VDQGLDSSAPPDDGEGDSRPLDGDGDSVPIADIGYDELRPGFVLLRNVDIFQLDPPTPPIPDVSPLLSPRDDHWPVFPRIGTADPGVLADPNMVLVFYQLVRPGNDLLLTGDTEILIWH